ncbi:MAG: hypothetical protein ACE5R6_17940 [Candidatus Heimdallarchaeota archaeon]
MPEVWKTQAERLRRSDKQLKKTKTMHFVFIYTACRSAGGDDKTIAPDAARGRCLS